MSKPRKPIAESYWVIEDRLLAGRYPAESSAKDTEKRITGFLKAGFDAFIDLTEADEMDFRRCLEIQLPYLGPVIGKYTDWTPLTNRLDLFPQDFDTSDPWQFKNVLVR